MSGLDAKGLRELLAKATPGEWRAVDEGWTLDSSNPWCVMAGEKYVASMHYLDHGPDDAPHFGADANAALIVAAVNYVRALATASAKGETK